MRKAFALTWVEGDPKVREWANALSKKAKSTGRNYSRLLYLYWIRNPRFRAFKNTGQWLTEITEQQNSPDITVRRLGSRNLRHSTYPTRAGPAALPVRAKTTYARLDNCLP